MKHAAWLLAAAILICCNSARAALWGQHYVENDAYGKCSDRRLSPDIRIEDCTKTLNARMLKMRSQLGVFDALASAFQDKYDYANAAVVLSKTIEEAQEMGVAYYYYRRGGNSVQQGALDLAATDFESARQNGGQAFAFAGAAEIADFKGKYTDAIDDYTKAMTAAAPKSPDFYQDRRSAIYAELGDYDNAMADANTVVQDWGQSSYALNERCWDRAVLNRDLDRAASDCKQALEILPDDPNTQDSLAFVYFRQGKWDDAIAEYDLALSHNPYFASSYYMRGITELRKGDTATGSADIGHAELIYPRIGIEYSRYGVIQ